MAMLYLNSLQERLRPVARLVFPSDPMQCVNLSNKNRYTRLYLRRIIHRAKSAPFNLQITNQQLARFFRISLKKFLLWFCHDVRLSKVFRRVRYFLREIIRLNIYEDRGELDNLIDRNITERPINWPSKKTMAYWKKQIERNREEYRNQGPSIETLSDAEELITCMQDGYSSSYSSESDSESIDYGVTSLEERSVSAINSETTESRALNGPPVVSNEDQLLQSFKNIVIKSDKSDNYCYDNDMFANGEYHSHR